MYFQLCPQIFCPVFIFYNVITMWSCLHGRKMTFVWRRSGGRVTSRREGRNQQVVAKPLFSWGDNPVWEQLQAIAWIHETLVPATCRSGSWAALCHIACGYPRAPGKAAPEGIKFNSAQTTKLVRTWLCYIYLKLFSRMWIGTEEFLNLEVHYELV